MDFVDVPRHAFWGRLQVRRTAMSGVIYFILVAVIMYPILRLFLSAFQIEKSGQPRVWTLANFVNIFVDPGVVSALKNTLILSIEATLLATTLGVLLAWLVARTDLRFKRFLEPVNMIPFYLSNLVGAIAWEMLATPRSGLLNIIAQQVLGLPFPPFNIYSLTGMAIVVGLHQVPFVYLFTLGSLSNMDPALEEAGRVSGASNASTMLRITLPLAAPAIMSAAILVFVLAASTFAVPLMLGGPKRIHTLSTFIWRYLATYPPNYNGASALSIFLLIITVFLIILQRKILAKRHFWTVTGKGFRPRLIPLGRWQWAALGINGMYLVVVLLPFLMLFIVSFVPRWAGGFDFKGFGLDNYKTVIIGNDVTHRALINSSIIAIVGASMGVGAALFLSAMILRTRLPGRSGIDFVAMSPMVFPGLVLGLAFLIAWIKTPLYGTLWILILAYVVHFMPTGLRSVTGTLGGIAPELDECARVCGAGWFGALCRILLPLMWPGLVSTWLLLFVIFLREVSSSMMLFVHGTETISIALIQIYQYEPLGVSSAFSVMLTAIILAGVYFVRKLASLVKMQMDSGETGQ
jgi:iron(III) transport system permease protein